MAGYESETAVDRVRCEGTAGPADPLFPDAVSRSAQARDPATTVAAGLPAPVHNKAPGPSRAGLHRQWTVTKMRKRALHRPVAEFRRRRDVLAKVALSKVN